MDIVRLFIDENYNIQGVLNPWILIIVLLVVLLYLKFTRGIFRKDYEVDEAELGIGSAKIKLKPNHDDLQIAYKLWVELNTRKIGLKIDIDNDVIVEVYNSWYEFFKITRELIKAIPVTKLRSNDSTCKLIVIATDVLNAGIRPHLTKWQARFRRWYELESHSNNNSEISPQDIQKKFPEYQDLITDLLAVNEKLIKYKNKLNEMVVGK